MCLRILSKKTYNILKLVNISKHFLKFKVKECFLVFVSNNGLKDHLKGLCKVGDYNFQTIFILNLSFRHFNLKPIYTLRFKAC